MQGEGKRAVKHDSKTCDLNSEKNGLRWGRLAKRETKRCFGYVSLRCLLEFQVEMSNMQLNICVLGSYLIFRGDISHRAAVFK